MLTYSRYLQAYLLVFAILLAGSFSASAQHIHTCSIIQSANSVSTDTPPDLPGVVQKAVSYKPGRTRSNQWAVGSTITIKFMGGSSYLQRQVLLYAKEWTRHANVNFRVVYSGSADIRVSFTQNGASWSMVGNGSAYANQDRPSMNLGWLTDRTPEYEIKRTVLHEFGHALGLLHEHQNPAGGIPWDENAVYDHYWQSQGWDRKTTYSNVMAVASRDATQYSAYDQASIMHYPVPAQLTRGQYSVGMNKDLSSTDKYYIAKLYPGRSSEVGQPTAPPTNQPTAKPTSQVRFPVYIGNALGRRQKEETIQLYIAERKFTIHLSRDGHVSGKIKLDLPKGKYSYRTVTSSTYYGYQKVYRNGVAHKKYIESEVPGGGSGVITVDGHKNLTFFGSYDRSKHRLNVYLGDSL